jgi:hypothetical protein
MATTTTKAVNFTNEQVKVIKSAFDDKITSKAMQKAVVESLALQLGKNSRSIIAKASSLGVYKKFEATTKTGAVVERKSDIVQKIAKKFDLDELAIESLENATKQALHAILNIKKAE